MQRLSTLFCAALSALALSPALAATKAALVESVLPSRPYNNSANGSDNNYVSLGPGASGTLGVGSITLTNMGGVDHTIFVFAPIFAGGQVCGSTTVIGGSYPRFYVKVPAGQTVHLTYPTPLVYPQISGQSCVAFGGAGGVDITVNGLVD